MISDLSGSCENLYKVLNTWRGPHMLGGVIILSFIFGAWYGLSKVELFIK